MCKNNVKISYSSTNNISKNNWQSQQEINK